METTIKITETRQIVKNLSDGNKKSRRIAILLIVSTRVMLKLKIVMNMNTNYEYLKVKLKISSRIHAKFSL